MKNTAATRESLITRSKELARRLGNELTPESESAPIRRERELVEEQLNALPRNEAAMAAAARLVSIRARAALVVKAAEELAAHAERTGHWVGELGSWDQMLGEIVTAHFSM